MGIDLGLPQPHPCLEGCVCRTPVSHTFVCRYLKRWVFVVCGGILPFGSIFIELYFVFTSFWNYKFYYVYGFMLLVLAILMIVTMCVSIVSIYFLLSAEDHRYSMSTGGREECGIRQYGWHTIRCRFFELFLCRNLWE